MLLIGLTRADAWIGPGPMVIGAIATVATWAALSVSMAMAWFAPDRVPAWVELARRDTPPRDR